MLNITFTPDVLNKVKRVGGCDMLVGGVEILGVVGRGVLRGTINLNDTIISLTSITCS
jgi:hypothetical protein